MSDLRRSFHLTRRGKGKRGTFPAAVSPPPPTVGARRALVVVVWFHQLQVRPEAAPLCRLPPIHTEVGIPVLIPHRWALSAQKHRIAVFLLYPSTGCDKKRIFELQCGACVCVYVLLVAIGRQCSLPATSSSKRDVIWIYIYIYIYNVDINVLLWTLNAI